MIPIDEQEVHAPQFNKTARSRHSTRASWLARQIAKCDELLANPRLSRENMKLVELLRTEFRQDVVTLEQRRDDDESCC